MKRVKTMCRSAALATAVWAAPAHGDLITRAFVAYGDSPLISVEQFGTTHAAATLSYTSPGSFTGESEAWASYGLVRAVARLTGVDTSYDTNTATAEAGFSDVLTINGSSGAGFIVYEYTLTGQTVGAEHDAHGHLFLRHQGEPDEELGEEITQGGIFTSIPHGFTFGTGFSTGILLGAGVHVHHGHTGVAIADFSAGAMLTGLSIFDAQMNPISQFSVASQSGTQYPLPAPGAGVLLAIALARPRARRA